MIYLNNVLSLLRDTYAKAPKDLLVGGPVSNEQLEQDGLELTIAFGYAPGSQEHKTIIEAMRLFRTEKGLDPAGNN